MLRAPGTFSVFKNELVAEARHSGDDAIANAKAGATNWSERVFAEIKERAAANPVAVGAIVAGIGWRVLRKPPITTMLVGYGLYSLFQTRPGHLAPGAETVYQAADAALAAKEQVEQWGKETGEIVAHAAGSVQALAASGAESVRRWGEGVGTTVAEASDSVQALAASGAESARRWGEDAGTTVAEASDSVQALAARGAESARRWGEDVGTTVAEASSSLQALATRESQRVHHMAMDRQERDKVLLGAAAVAITTALGLAWLRKS